MLSSVNTMIKSLLPSFGLRFGLLLAGALAAVSAIAVSALEQFKLSFNAYDAGEDVQSQWRLWARSPVGSSATPDWTAPELQRLRALVWP